MGDLSSFLAGEDPPSEAGQGQPPGVGAPEAAAETKAVAADSGRVMVNDRYEIYTDRPLNDYGSITAMTFAATDRRDATAELVGYVCQTGLPPRWDIMSSIRGLDTPTVVKVVDYRRCRMGSRQGQAPDDRDAPAARPAAGPFGEAAAPPDGHRLHHPSDHLADHPGAQ